MASCCGGVLPTPDIYATAGGPGTAASIDTRTTSRTGIPKHRAGANFQLMELCATSQATDLARFVRAYPGAIDDALAADLIALPGAQKMDLSHRRCSLTPIVGDVLERFRGVVRECFLDYRAISTTLYFCTRLEAPNVLRYEPSTPDRPEWFHEHADAYNCPSATRQVSVVAYLNDVAVGGETVFTAFDHSQRCEKGTVLFFPSNYLYHHLARPPESGPKIVVVTWLHFGNDGQPTYLTMPLGLKRDRDFLLSEVERNPTDAKSVFDLAQSYFDSGEFANARKWYAQRAQMGGSAEEVYYSLYRVAATMANLGEPWPDIQDALLRAWAFRPTRAEPLYQIAVHYRAEQQYQLGYLYAERAAQIPLPEADVSVDRDIYTWCAIDEQAVCASWIGKHAEAFTLCRRLLARPDIPDLRRRAIAGNRDFSVPAMIEAASAYPDVLVGSLVAGPRDSEVTVTLVAGPDQQATEQTLNSFLHCCTDLSRVGRFVVLDAGLSARDRTRLRKRYGFLEFADCGPGAPAWATPRTGRRTVVAASGPRLAVFCPRKLHHPAKRGARRRTTSIPGRHQLWRRSQADRYLRRRARGSPRTRCRPLRPGRRGGPRPGDVRHRTTRPGRRP